MNQPEIKPSTVWAPRNPGAWQYPAPIPFYAVVLSAADERISYHLVFGTDKAQTVQEADIIHRIESTEEFLADFEPLGNKALIF